MTRLAILLAAAACGDNLTDLGPPLAPADTLIVVAHFDDDMIFMQPQLAEELAHGSLSTVYVTSGDPVKGPEHADATLTAAMIAYEHATGSRDWDCGYVVVANLPVHHCRLRDRPVSMIGLDVPDGARYGERADSLLHLVEGGVPSLPLLGPFDGRVTTDALIAELAQIVTLTAPREIHTLDRAATHGDDHSSHLFTASFAFWAAASIGYLDTIVSHRGYNVGNEQPNLSDADYAFVKPMLAYFEACYAGCAPCGTACTMLDESHETWLRRQYASTASTRTAVGALETAAVPGSCIALAANGSTELTDCADAAAARLTGDGHLRAGGLCAASGAANDDPIAFVACADEPAQYWLLDDEGFVWNGRPPTGVAGMNFDHVRCLEASPGATARAPICGDRRRPRWRLIP